MTDDIASWRNLTSEVVASLAPDDELRHSVAEFEALPFAAGKDAERWLQECMANATVPFETRLALGPRQNVLGFFALQSTSVPFSRRDSIILLLRRRDARARDQPGSIIAWIARSRQTNSGFGEQLVGEAMTVAREELGSTFIVAEAQEETTETIWFDYRFMRFDGDDDDTSPDRFPRPLWHAVDELKVGGWPS